VQRVLVKSATAGSFTLSLTHNSQTYTTTGINIGANAATVRYALNAALGNAGSVEVTGTATEGYQITFGGALAGTNLADLVVTTSQSAPSGSFTLSYNGQTTGAINYSTDGAKLAKNIQTALSALSTIGAGNIAVSYNAGQSTSDLIGLDIRFTGTLANSNASQISVNATGLSNAAASVRTVTSGVANTNQVQTVTLGTDAQTDGYTLSLTYLGQSYSTALIAGNASQAQIQSAVNAAFGQIAGAQFTVSKTGANLAISASGSLSGQNLNLINLQAVGAVASGSSITKSFVVGNTTQNAANLKAAFAELLNTDAANISVSYDSSYRAGQRYVVSFVGALSGVDIADKGISVTGTSVAYKLLSDGVAGQAEIQTITVDRDASTLGVFRLSLTHGGKTYTTADIALGASLDSVQAALRAATVGSTTEALSSLGLILVDGTVDAYTVRFAGALAGTNVAELKLAALSVDAEMPSGNFQISYVDANGTRQYSGAIAYDSNSTTLKNNIQGALDTLFGAGKVTVSIDAAQSAERKDVFVLNFTGSLAYVDVADITTHYASSTDTNRNLSLAVVKPINLAQGQAKTGELQTLTIDSVASDVAFTLSLSHGGQSATSATLSTGLTQAELQTELDAMMATLNGALGGGFAATATVELWNAKALQVRFGGSLLGVNVADLQAVNVAKTFSTGIQTQQAGSTTEIAAKPQRTLVVDYAAGKTDLTVTTGPGSSLKLSMDGAKGNLLQASGNLELDVFGFFGVKGNLAIEKSSNTVTLGDAQIAGDGTVTKPASQINVDMLSIGGSNLNAYAGINGGFNADGSLKDTATGLSLSGVEFGLAIAGEQLSGLEAAGTVARSWTSLSASAAGAAFVGVDGLTLSADTLNVEINRQAADGSLVDYKAQGLEINTGTTAEPSSLTLNLDASEGQLLRATGNLELDIFGFVQVAGGFGIEKKTGQITLADVASTTTVDESATPVAVDMLLVGGSGLNAFLGAGNVGLQLSETDIGIALLSEQLTQAQITANTVARSWSSVQAQIGSAEFVGVEGLTIGVQNLSIAINRQAVDTSVVDYSFKVGSSTERKTDISILTGPASQLTLEIDGARGQTTQARGQLELDIFGFVQLDGEFAIEKASTAETLTLSDGTTASAQVLRIGASNVNAFAGINGGQDNAIGLELAGVEFGLALMGEQLATGATTPARSWTSLQAKAQSAALVGVEGLTARADTIQIEVNRAGTLDGAVVDYSLKDGSTTERKTALTVATGTSSELDLNMDGAQGRLLRASANMELDAFGFFQASGAFALEKRTETFQLNDGVISEDPLLAKKAT